MIGKRVEIPPFTDWWMRGARYGEVVKVTKLRHNKTEVAHVKLDVSGKTIRVLLEDCREVT